MTTRAVAKEKFGEQVVSGISCKYCRLPTSIQMVENMSNLPDRKANQKWLKIAFTFCVSLFFFFFFLTAFFCFVCVVQAMIERGCEERATPFSVTRL